MQTKTFERLAVMALAVAIIALATFGALMLNTPTQAAPPAAPTPVADFLVNSRQPSAFPMQAETALTADTNTAGIDAMGYGAVDIQYIIDETTANTTTLKVQYSNDNTNWVDGLTLVSGAVADGTSITRVPMFGRWMRINQDVSTTDTITITLLAVAR